SLSWSRIDKPAALRFTGTQQDAPRPNCWDRVGTAAKDRELAWSESAPTRDRNSQRLLGDVPIETGLYSSFEPLGGRAIRSEASLWLQTGSGLGCMIARTSAGRLKSPP